MDFKALSAQLSQSCWREAVEKLLHDAISVARRRPLGQLTCATALMRVVTSSFLAVSPTRLDPAWCGSKTELPYLNSVKMKMSILLGVLHMNLGIIMSLFNNSYFRDYLSTWCEFVPQMIFLNGLFGYLCFLIVFKWVTPNCFADLYHVLIAMFLDPGTVDKTGFLFTGQAGLQVLLLLCLVAVPWMLLLKPLILKSHADKAKKAGGE